MVNFLKKYQEELISEKIEIKENADLLDTKIREERKFLDLLESSNDSYFTVFTPRNVNEKNNVKAEEIKDTLIKLEAAQQVNVERIKAIDSRLQEVTSLINGSVISSISDINNSKKEAEVKVNIDELIEKLYGIKSFVLVDPYRASLEIDTLINTLSD